ncbi:MAG: mobile mystery protein B [Aestuariivirga sp.]|nr:mobile mystery protein B [Aestuariivirga sp.]
MTFVMSSPEGATPLDPNERDGLKHRHITTQGELNELEQANIIAGLHWLRRLRRPDVLSDAFALQLHKRLFGDVWDWGGKLRQTGKNIGIDPIHIAVQLRACIDDARFWLEHETCSPMEAALRFHHRLTVIHPFPNGNGRHARIMADALLGKVYGVAPIDWAGGEALQNNSERRTNYINALRAADRGEFGLLFSFAGMNQ